MSYFLSLTDEDVNFYVRQFLRRSHIHSTRLETGFRQFANAYRIPSAHRERVQSAIEQRKHSAVGNP